MKFIFLHFFKTAFHIAVDKGNTDIVKLLLHSNKIDANLTSILAIIIHSISNYQIQ